MLKNIKFEKNVGEPKYPVRFASISISNGSERLKELCEKNIISMYNTNEISVAKEMLVYELEAVRNTGREYIFLIIKEIMEKLGISKEDIYINNLAAGSIICYLLGITHVDPVKYDLKPELIYGLNKNRAIIITTNYSMKNRTEIINIIGDSEGLLGCIGMKEYMADEDFEDYVLLVPDYLKDEKINLVKYDKDDMNLFIRCNYFEGEDVILPEMSISNHPIIELLSRLSDICKVSSKEICIDEEKQMQLLTKYKIPGFNTKYSKDAFEVLKPNTFDEYVKALGVSNGTDTWIGNAEEAYCKGEIAIDDIIASRDDVYDYCLELGMSMQESYFIAEDVRKGKVARRKSSIWGKYKEKLISRGASDYFITSCEKITYLLSKAQLIEYLIIVIKVLWYRDNYNEAYSIIENELDIEKAYMFFGKDCDE